MAKKEVELIKRKETVNIVLDPNVPKEKFVIMFIYSMSDQHGYWVKNLLIAASQGRIGSISLIASPDCYNKEMYRNSILLNIVNDLIARGKKMTINLSFNEDNHIEKQVIDYMDIVAIQKTVWAKDLLLAASQGRLEHISLGVM